eukprot:365845-Chlamydomonas_euryale.AAC.8
MKSCARPVGDRRRAWTLGLKEKRVNICVSCVEHVVAHKGVTERVWPVQSDRAGVARTGQDRVIQPVWSVRDAAGRDAAGGSAPRYPLKAPSLEPNDRLGAK